MFQNVKLSIWGEAMKNRKGRFEFQSGLKKR